MITADSNSMIDELLQPVSECFTPAVARRIADLRAGAKLQTRVEDLAEKANAGTLSESERSEYEEYIRFSQFVALLQIKARESLEAAVDDR